MHASKRNSSKDAYGITPRRSEYDDAILRNNQRTGNRLKRDMHYQERAQRVIMKDLGKESLLLQSKLESDRKTLSLGLFGSKFGTATANPVRKYSSTSPNGKVLSTSSFRPAERNFLTSKSENRFPWDKDVSDRDSSMEKASVFSNTTTPIHTSRTNMRFRTPSGSAYMSSRAQTDDFLANILNEAMNDELMYTQSAELANLTSETPRNGTSSRKTRKTPRNRLLDTPTDSIVNALANANQPTPDD